MYYNKEHEEKVESRGDGYTYIGSYHQKDETLDGKNKNKRKDTYIRVKCPYCSEEYDVRLQHFKNGSKCPNCCNFYENSFAYHIEIELNEKLDKYWSDKNTLNPYHITKYTHDKIWIKCTEKDYHDDYITTPAKFVGRGDRCPFCSHKNGKTHKLDSFGALYPDKAKYWCESNKKSPYEVTPHSHRKYKFICEKCGEEFERTLNNLNQNDNGVVCLKCNSSQLEYKTREILKKYNIIYEEQVQYDGLIGLNSGNLSYDFYLPQYNLLIECQGIQHEVWQRTWMVKYKFEKQLEHDRRKREYAEKHNIDLLEIWYYDIDNIEDIIINKLNLKEGDTYCLK